MFNTTRTTLLTASLVLGAFTTSLTAAPNKGGVPTLIGFETPPAPATDLEMAIHKAEDGDTIVVSEGIHTITLDIHEKSLHFVGAGKLPSHTVIVFGEPHTSCQRYGHNLSGERPDQGNDPELSLSFENLTFSSRSDERSATLWCADVNLDFINCRFTGMRNAPVACPGQADPSDYTYFAKGGALHLDNCNVRIQRCRFEDNHAWATGHSVIYAQGGAIYAEESWVSISDSSFIGNHAHAWAIPHPQGDNVEIESYATGGAIHALDTQLDINDSTFQDNSTTLHALDAIDDVAHPWSNGGAIFVMSTNDDRYLKPRINDCQFTDNQVFSDFDGLNQDQFEDFLEVPAGWGGALCFYMNAQDWAKVQNCRFLDNQASAGDAIVNLGNYLMLSGNEFLCDDAPPNTTLYGAEIDDRGNFFGDCDLEPVDEVCLYDVNGDGVVDQRDYDQAFIAYYRNRHDGPEDVNGDGRVDRSDVNLIRDNFGECP